ncbi:MAG: Protein YgiW [Desulfovibrio sp.]
MTMLSVYGKTERQKKKRLFAMLVAGVMLFPAFGASAAFAKNHSGSMMHVGGGYTGPGPQVVTVEQAKGMRDDAPVALKGYIVQNLGNEDYLFKDATGTITVEIDHDKWAGQNIGPDDLVQLYGEVDKDWSGVEIDVDRVVKQ